MTFFQDEEKKKGKEKEIKKDIKELTLSVAPT